MVTTRNLKCALKLHDPNILILLIWIHYFDFDMIDFEMHIFISICYSVY